MTAPRRANPLVFGYWRRAGETSALALTLHDPASGRSCPLSRDELWAVDLLAQDAAGDRTRDGIAAAAAGHAPPSEPRDALLSRLWDTAFIAAADPLAPPDRGIGLWERHGWKVALEYYVSMENGSRPDRQPGGHAAERPEATGVADIPLPDAQEPPVLDLSSALKQRRTCRRFGGQALRLATLATILRHVRDRGDRDGAVALCPDHLVCHVLAMRVPELSPGVYRYDPAGHRLAQVRVCASEALEQELVALLIGQRYVLGSAAAVLLSGNLDRVIAEQARPAAFAAWLMGAGALAQRLLVIAQTLKVESFMSAAIDENCVRRSTAGESGGAVSPAHLVAFGGAQDDAET